MAKRFFAVIVLVMMIVSTTKVEGLEYNSVNTIKIDDETEITVNNEKEQMQDGEENNEEQDLNSVINQDENQKENDEYNQNDQVLENKKDNQQNNEIKQVEDHVSDYIENNEQNIVLQSFEMIIGELETQVNGDETEVKIILKDTDINGIGKAVKFAVWSEEGEQDDLKWYTASLDGEGNYIPIRSRSKITKRQDSIRYTATCRTTVEVWSCLLRVHLR